MENKKVKKYYVEIWPIDGGYTHPYIMQSRWFDTPEEAIKWAEGIDYMDNEFCKSLMSAEWNEAENRYEDIDLEYNI